MNLEDFTLEVRSKPEDEFSGSGEHDLQRKACLAYGGAVNHGGAVILREDKDFDLNKTIFGGVSGLMGIKRTMLKFKLSNKLYWNNEGKVRNFLRVRELRLYYQIQQ